MKEREYGVLEYSVSIKTDQSIVLYVPLMLDLPNQTVSNLIDLIKVENNEDQNISYDVVETSYGMALSIKTSKDVILKATMPYEEFFKKNHPILIDPDNLHFDMSMKKNSTYFEGRGIESSHWIYIEPISSNLTQHVMVELKQKITTSGGVEYWKSYKDDTLNYGYSNYNSGWDLIRIESGVAVY